MSGAECGRVGWQDRAKSSGVLRTRLWVRGSAASPVHARGAGIDLGAVHPVKGRRNAGCASLSGVVRESCPRVEFVPAGVLIGAILTSGVRSGLDISAPCGEEHGTLVSALVLGASGVYHWVSALGDFRGAHALGKRGGSCLEKKKNDNSSDLGKEVSADDAEGSRVPRRVIWSCQARGCPVCPGWRQPGYPTEIGHCPEGQKSGIQAPLPRPPQKRL